MSLRQRLRNTPVMLELIPPPQRAGERFVRNLLERYVKSAYEQLEIDACNVPEIVEENHRGEPFRRNMDPREFVLRMRSACGDEEVVVNKIVAHCQGGEEELTRWAESTRDEYGIRNVVAVGGSSSQFRYPGPTVLKANQILRGADLLVGNIMIPERDHEAGRMLVKTLHGAQFFTTQVVFSVQEFLDELRRYRTLCEAQGVDPATVFVSFAPVSDGDDLTFLRWLGIRITPAMEDQLLNGTPDPAAASAEMAVRNWRRIRHQQEGYQGVPLALNVEYINRHNFAPAIALARRLIQENGGGTGGG